MNVSLVPWMGFLNVAADRYYFLLRICKYLVVGDYPLIEIGASWIDILPSVFFKIEEILKAAPKLIEEDDNFPLANLTGDWDCPVALKFDKASAPTLVNPTEYTSLSVIPWSVPHFLQSTLEYIPLGDPFTEIPESKTNFTKEVLPGNGAIFMPNKDQYYEDDYTFAERFTTFNYSTFSWWGQMFFDGCDIGESHVLNNYDTNHPTPTDPNSTGAGVWGVNSCYSEKNGYDIYYDSGSGFYGAKVDRYESSLNPEYYPPRKEVSLPIVDSILYPLLPLSQFGDFYAPGDKRRRFVY